MSWRWYRDDCGFHYGWISERWWFSLASVRTAVYLDVGTWRIRWARPGHRPLFSERYGHQKWHKIGRLAANHKKRRTP